MKIRRQEVIVNGTGTSQEGLDDVEAIVQAQRHHAHSGAHTGHTLTIFQLL